MYANGEINKSRNIRILVLGDVSVGKSTFLHRFCSLSDEILSTRSTRWTVGADVRVCPVPSYIAPHLPPTVDNYIEFIEVGGHPKFALSRDIFYEKIDAIICMFDSNNRRSFVNCFHWLREALNTLQSRGEFQYRNENENFEGDYIESTPSPLSYPPNLHHDPSLLSSNSVSSSTPGQNAHSYPYPNLSRTYSTSSDASSIISNSFSSTSSIRAPKLRRPFPPTFAQNTSSSTGPARNSSDTLVKNSKYTFGRVSEGQFSIFNKGSRVSQNAELHQTSHTTLSDEGNIRRRRDGSLPESQQLQSHTRQCRNLFSILNPFSKRSAAQGTKQESQGLRKNDGTNPSDEDEETEYDAALDQLSNIETGSFSSLRIARNQRNAHHHDMSAGALDSDTTNSRDSRGTTLSHLENQDKNGNKKDQVTTSAMDALKSLNFQTLLSYPMPIIFVGTKIDLASRTNSNLQQWFPTTETLDAPILFTSAHTISNDALSEAHTVIFQMIYDHVVPFLHEKVQYETLLEDDPFNTTNLGHSNMTMPQFHHTRPMHPQQQHQQQHQQQQQQQYQQHQHQQRQHQHHSSQQLYHQNHNTNTNPHHSGLPSIQGTTYSIPSVQAWNQNQQSQYIPQSNSLHLSSQANENIPTLNISDLLDQPSPSMSSSSGHSFHNPPQQNQNQYQPRQNSTNAQHQSQSRYPTNAPYSQTSSIKKNPFTATFQ